jgi:cellulose synthase/poly-beta-1,6-N-acetylglucosamine synthase-like glycosyltransferase
LSTTTSAVESVRVAVVAIGRNEGERLRACLTSVLAMDFPRNLLDILYVDSASTDNSVALAQSLGIRTIALDGPTTAARARNAGWTQTSAPLVLFLDGDTLLHPQFVRKSISHFADPSIAGVWGDRREMRTADSIYNALFDLDWNTQPGFTLYFGGDALVRRDALDAVGGYDERLIAGEEPEMCRRMRERDYRILHVAEPMTGHDLAMHSFAQYWRRSLRTGHAYAEISSLYSNTADPLWTAESHRNIVRGLCWLVAPVGCTILSLALRSWLPIGLFAAGAAALGARTAMRTTSRLPGKARSPRLLLAYALHSHLQQVPIFFGQLRFWLQRRRGRRSAIIEYKTS